MEKSRSVFWTGAILGNAVAAVDAWITSIPYEIIIPIEFTSIVLIFAGFIMRKNERKGQSA